MPRVLSDLNAYVTNLTMYRKCLSSRFDRLNAESYMDIHAKVITE